MYLSFGQLGFYLFAQTEVSLVIHGIFVNCLIQVSISLYGCQCILNLILMPETLSQPHSEIVWLLSYIKKKCSWLVLLHFYLHLSIKTNYWHYDLYTCNVFEISSPCPFQIKDNLAFEIVWTRVQQKVYIYIYIFLLLYYLHYSYRLMTCLPEILQARGANGVPCVY